jgi:hypothetical protein
MGTRQQDYDVRFRHVAGDIGPFKLPPHTTVEEMKEKLLEAWPLGAPKMGPRSGRRSSLCGTCCQARLAGAGAGLCCQLLTCAAHVLICRGAAGIKCAHLRGGH